MRLARCHHVIVRGVLLKHEPHGFHVVSGVTPIALRVEIAEKQLLLQPALNAAECARYFARYKRFPPPWGFVIEENAVAQEQFISLAVIHAVPVRGHLADAVRTARVERRSFILWGRRRAEHLGRPGLINANAIFAVHVIIPDHFEQAQRTGSYYVGGVLRLIEADSD